MEIWNLIYTMYCGDFFIIPLEKKYDIHLLRDLDDEVVGFELNLTDNLCIEYFGNSYIDKDAINQDFNFKYLDNLIEEKKRGSTNDFVKIKIQVTHWALDKQVFIYLFDFFKYFGIGLVEKYGTKAVKLPYKVAEKCEIYNCDLFMKPPQLTNYLFLHDKFLNFSSGYVLKKYPLYGSTELMIDKLNSAKRDMDLYPKKHYSLETKNFKLAHVPWKNLHEVYNEREIFPTGLSVKCYSPFVVNLNSYSNNVWYVQVGTYHDEVMQHNTLGTTDYKRFLLKKNGVTEICCRTGGNIYLVCEGMKDEVVDGYISSVCFSNNENEEFDNNGKCNYIDHVSDDGLIWCSVPVNMHKILKGVWDNFEKGVKYAYDFKGIPISRPVYFVFTKPAYGSLHSGYPIVFYENYLNEVSSKIQMLSDIGHEVGHNLDVKGVPNILGEISNDLFTFYGIWRYMTDGKKWAAKSNKIVYGRSGAEREELFLNLADTIVRMGTNKDKLTKFEERSRNGTGYGFSLFYILIRKFGWDKMKEFMCESTKIDCRGSYEIYFNLMSRVLKCDLNDFLREFGFSARNPDVYEDKLVIENFRNIDNIKIIVGGENN